MKIKILVMALASVGLAGCETLLPKKEAAKPPEERIVEKVVEKVVYKQPSNIVVESAPLWMTKLPKEPGILFASASGRSQDYGMAVEKAKTMAQAKIAEMLDTKIDKQTKIYQADKNGSFTENSSTAVRKSIEEVNLLGIETVEVKVLLESPTIYRAFVLVAIKMEEQKPEPKPEPVKEVDEETKAFEDLGKKKSVPKAEKISQSPTNNGVIVTPVANLDRSRMIVNTISDQSVKDRVAEVLKDPNAVVLNATLR